ncbi:MAG TPA: hypothetical protein VEM13_03575 [Gemmatimonadales bacterium]|nr:hypothetical protein [Gemmatimonadales bacterium]
MKQILKNERGMALAIAIVALVVVGALVAGALFSGTQEQRVAENLRRVQASFGVAEQGVNEIIRVWPNSTTTFNSMGWYPTATGIHTFGLAQTSSGTGKYSGKLYKMNNEIYFIDITGQDAQSLGGTIQGGGASQRIGMLATIRPLDISIGGALTSGGANVLKGSSLIDGNDHTPDGWTSCDPTGAPIAGIRVQADGTVNDTSGIYGTPKLLRDSTLKDSSFSKYGDVTYWSLAARATITWDSPQNFNNNIQPSTVGTQCNTGDKYNWGDPQNPTAPCGGYFPIIHIAGSGTSVINGQEGQGILLIDGDLSVQGGFQWFGIVIIKGSLKTSGGGSTDAHFWGAVLAQDTVAFGSDTVNDMSGHANLLFSNCAIIKALDNTGVVAAMRSRGWVQLF